MSTQVGQQAPLRESELATSRSGTEADRTLRSMRACIRLDKEGQKTLCAAYESNDIAISSK